MSDDGNFERSSGRHVISDDLGRFDMGAFCEFIESEAGGVRERSPEATAVAVARSVVLGLYEPEGAMVGAVRVVSDWVTFGWLCDLYVREDHRGLGLGQALVSAACEHPALAEVERVVLAAPDGHELFHPLGFDVPVDPYQWLERRPGARPVRRESGDNLPTSAVASMAAPAEDLGEPVAYAAWSGAGLPDPRTARTADVAAHLFEIITAEGPILADRAFRLFIKGAGSVKVTQRAREPLELALGRLARRGDLKVDEIELGDSTQQVARRRDIPPVMVRKLGDRDLYEVPLNEIAALMGRNRRLLTEGPDPYYRPAVTGLIQARAPRIGPDELKRSVLDTYGLIRMTQAADNYLDAALRLLDGPGPDPDTDDLSPEQAASQEASSVEAAEPDDSAK